MQLLHFTLRDKILRFLEGILVKQLEAKQNKQPAPMDMTSSMRHEGQGVQLNMNTNITLVVPQRDKSNLMDEIKTRYSKKHFQQVDGNKIQAQTGIDLDKVIVVMSATAGQGKTFAIEKYCRDQKYDLLVITLAGSMTPELLDSRLEALYLELEETKRKPLALRIKLDMVDDDIKYTPLLGIGGRL